MKNQPIYVMPIYKSHLPQPGHVITAPPSPTETSLTEVPSLTEMDRQLIQIKKDMAEMNRAMIKNKKKTLEEVKTQI